MAASKYAQGTAVPVQRSLAELQALCNRFGAKRFGYATDENGRSVVTFATGNRVYRLEVEPSTTSDHKFTPSGRIRDAATASKAADEETARRWRSLVLLMKALLVAVEDGLMTPETALLPWTVLPDGRTLEEWAVPAIESAYTDAGMPAIASGT